jgi:CarD family transcriptional regulator
LDFRRGESVVYPNQGVGVIEDIMELPISGEARMFYRLRLLANNSKVMVPQEKSADVGLRRVIQRDEVAQLLSILRTKSKSSNNNNWKGRFKENSDRMRGGSIFDVAEVLKDLVKVSKTKELSYRERSMMDRARFMIVSEIAHVKRVPNDRAQHMVDEALAVSTKAGKEPSTKKKAS